MVEEVEITVASAHIPGRVDYRPEARLLRSALLYGDRVTLFSLFGDLIDKGRALGDLDEDGLIDLVLDDSRQRASERFPSLKLHFETYRRLRSKRGKTRQEMLFVAKEKEGLQRLAREMKENSERLLEEMGANELVDLLRTGLVEVRTIDTPFPFGDNPTGILDYVKLVSEHLSTARTYPLLDQTVSKLLSPAVESGDLVLLEGASDRGKRVSLAADLLFRLPTLDTISSRDILSIRNELASPLIRFRAAVIQMSRELQSALWEPAFSREAQSIYDSRVVPALLDIGEAVTANSWLSELLSSVASKGAVIPAASAVGMLIAHSSAVPSLLLQILSATAGAGLVANDAVRRWQANQAATKRNQLFYYWKLLQR